MKKIFYLSVSLLFTITTFAQSPGGVANSVLWLKGNTGASASAWNDNSLSLNNFLQTAPANQPVLVANTFNFNAALAFDGSNTFMSNPTPVGFPINGSDRTAFVVATGSNLGSGYKWIFVYGTPSGGTAGTSFQFGRKDANLANSFYGNDIFAPNYWNSAVNANGALAALTLSGGTGIQYDRGSLIQSQALGPLTATSVNGVIGALNTTPGEAWLGSIGEVILFPSALSAADRNKVESYLALKYGFTLGNTTTPLNYTASDGTTVYWTASTTYQNDVFGIGTDAAGSALTQQQSNSMNSGNGDGSGQAGKGNLILSSATPLLDKQFLTIGNDAGTFTENTIAIGEAATAAVGSQRVARNWKVQNTGTVGAVDLSFDITGLLLAGGTTASNNYRLMIDEDGNGNYADGTQTFVKPAGFTGTKLNFSGVTLNNGAVFTLITQATALLPALWQGFTATLVKNAATLVWQTSNEVNVDHYTVEYSANGVNFTAAGSVTAKNSAGINTYSLVQDNLPAGTRYYRIRRVDKDGNSVVSDIRTVRAGGGVVVLLRANPIVKGRLELNIDVPQNQDAEIRVLNVAGKMLTQQHKSLTTGTNTVIANVTSASAGVYFVQVQLGTQVITRKFVKQ